MTESSNRTQEFIRKYPVVDFIDVGTRFLLPKGRVVLVAAQNPADELPTIWIEHDGKDNVSETYRLIGTGLDFDKGWAVHVGSAICNNGRLVWHVYRYRETR